MCIQEMYYPVSLSDCSLPAVHSIRKQRVTVMQVTSSSSDILYNLQYELCSKGTVLTKSILQSSTIAHDSF